MDHQEAAGLARRLIAEECRGRDWELIAERTVKRDLGWVFFYQARRYLETGQARYMLLGAGPVYVVSATGAVVALGSSRPWEELVRAFETELGQG